MAASVLEAATLVPFEDAAAGHDGTLTDPSGLLFVKPCKQREITFYEQAIAHHPDFAEFMPAYFGTLSLTSPEQELALLETQDSVSIKAVLESITQPVNLGIASIPHSIHGKKIATGQALVLENLIAGFVKPNILDVKLGAQLWDEDSPPSKRQRLDKVAAETTSSTLGFRVAGMRVWQAASQCCGNEEDMRGPKVFDKFYGRQFTTANVQDAFREFFFGAKDKDRTRASARDVVLQICASAVEQIQEVLEQQESRMVSASLLMVFEGDAKALEERVAVVERQGRDSQRVCGSVETSLDDGDESDDDEVEELAICRVRMIDFAHASWTPGFGRDENTLTGVRNVRKILEDIYKTS